MRAWGGAGGGDFGSLGKPGAGSVLLLLLRPAARPFLSRFCLGFASGPFWGGFGPFWGGFGGVRGLRGGNLGQGCPERLRIPSPRVFGRKPPPEPKTPPKWPKMTPPGPPPKPPPPDLPITQRVALSVYIYIYILNSIFLKEKPYVSKAFFCTI